MPISWNSQTIAWFKAASSYSDFHHKLADLLRPSVAGSGSMYDLGCGLALLSQQLHDIVEEIVCVDLSEAALASVKQDLISKNIQNIRPQLGDCYENDPLCDVILLSYFGSGTLERFLSACRTLISIVDWDADSSMAGSILSATKRSRQTALHVEKQLRENEIQYTLLPVSLEFGQPFVSHEEAVYFLQQYYHCSFEETESFLAERLMPANRRPYSYYLPYQKKMGVFIIKGNRQ